MWILYKLVRGRSPCLNALMVIIEKLEKDVRWRLLNHHILM